MIRVLLFLSCLLLSPVIQADSKILVVGDSLSAGYGLQANEGWVDLLSAKLKANKYPYSVVNASISGDTTSNGLERLPIALEKTQPAIVLIELGANDGLRGFSLKNMKSHLAKMIDLSLDSNSQVLLIGMQLPPNYGAFYIKKFHEVYLELANEKNIPLVPFLFDGFEKNLDFFQRDKIHPNEKAQSMMLENVWEKLAPILQIDAS